jgi:ribosome biogenesis protein MAK21
LGLTGTFPDDSESEDDEDAEEWTDEDKSEEVDIQKPPSKTTVPAKTQIIDRPVQLSSATKADERKPTAQKRGKLKLEPHSLWFEIEHSPITPATTAPNAEVIKHLHSRGTFLLQTEAEAYLSSNHITSSDRQFLSTIMSSGTQSDKLSALTLSISSSPIHCQKQLDALLGMAKKKSRNEAVQAIAAIKDLLVGNLLPDRKLVYFGKQVGLSSTVKDDDLILWAFEDWLKGWYFQVLKVIEVLFLFSRLIVRNYLWINFLLFEIIWFHIFSSYCAINLNKNNYFFDF